MRLSLRPAAFSLLSAALPLTGCAIHLKWNSPDVWVEESEQFDVGATDLERLAAVTDNGSVTLRAAAASETTVHVTAVKRAGGDDEADARAALACLTVSCRTEGAVLHVEAGWARSPDSSWGSCVSFEITAPARLAARLESHNGEITVSGTAGRLDLVSHNGRVFIDSPSTCVAALTHNGGVEYRGPAQEIALETHNGWVKAKLTGGPVNGRIVTHNGAIVVEAAGALRGTLQGETHNGSISLAAHGSNSTVRDDSFRIEYADPGAGRLEVTTHNGSIEVR